MTPVLFLGICIFIASTNIAYSNTDSLFQLTYPDTVQSVEGKVEYAKALSEKYSLTDINKSIVCDKAIYHFSKIKNDNEGMVGSLERIWDSQNRLCEYQQADSTLHILLSHVVKYDDKNDIAEVMFNIASNYYDWSDYANANTYFVKAQTYFTVTNNKQGIAKSMKGVAVVVSNWGDYEKAIGLLRNARDIYSEINDQMGLAGIYLGLGVVMQEWNKLDRALEYFNLALEYYQSNGLKRNEVNMLLHIGDIYLQKKDFDDAIKIFRRAQNLESHINHKKLRSIALSNIGEAFYHLNQLDSALIYQARSLVLKNEIGDNKRITISYWIIGNIYSKLKQSDSSLNYLGRSLLLAREIGYRDIEIDALKSLSELYFSMNNLFLAYAYLKEYQELKEFTFNDNTNRMLEELAVKFEADKKEVENEILKQNNDIQQLQLEKERNSKFFIIIFASFIVFIAFIIVFFINYRVKDGRKNFSVLTFKNKEITRQKEKLSSLNEELAESREKFKGIVENATIGIFQTNPEGEVLFANKQLLETLGYEVFNDLQGVDLNMENPNRKDFLSLIKKDKVITGREDIWNKADGSKMYVMESAWLVHNTDGSIKYIEGLVEDITMRKEIELALVKSELKLKETNTKLRNKNKIVEKARQEAENAYQAKSSFLANVSHEIRTPMNSVIGFTELLLGIEKEPKKLSYISAIDSSSKSLLALINDILDLSRVQAGKLDLIYEPVSLRSIINEIEHIFSLQIVKKKILFIKTIDEAVPDYISCDGVRIRQVVFNLIGNAIKFTDEGFVKIDVKVKSNKGKSELFDLSIIVSDSGPGISKNDQTMIFSAFSQSNNIFEKSYSGTGLGLSITKQLVELMNGELSLDSELGKGSVFTISIPEMETIKVRKSESIGKKETFVTEQKKVAFMSEDLISVDLSTIDDLVRRDLNEQFGSLFHNLLSTRLIEDILDFAEKINEFAASKNVEPLHDISIKLKDACDKFEIDNIESIITLLKTLFDGK